MINTEWEQYIKSQGADFVCFVDVSSLPVGMTDGYICAVLFGKVLPRQFLKNLIQGISNEIDYFVKGEHDMDKLADKLAEELNALGYSSLSQSEKANFNNNRFHPEIRSSFLPHKTIALMAGLGFIGKNNLLVNSQYGCAVVLGSVITKAPFEAVWQAPQKPECGACTACVDACNTHALRGATWTAETSRDEMVDVNLCNCALCCMINCPYTVRYANDNN